VLFEAGIRRLGSKERGFFYRYPDTNANVREERVLERIENLKVPPAWEDTRIARSPSAKVQAIGYDPTGGLQYVYNARYQDQKEREKSERVVRAGPALRGRVASDPQDYKRLPQMQ
jgi:DNA topoisomerase-1